MTLQNYRFMKIIFLSILSAFIATVTACNGSTESTPSSTNLLSDDQLLEMLNLLHRDRMQHRKVSVEYDRGQNQLVFKQKFVGYTVKTDYVFHARWAETLITLGGSYVKRAGGGFHSFENDPHNYHNWQEYNFNHVIKLDGKPFKNADFDRPARVNSNVFIDHRGFSTLLEVTNSFLTRLFTDVMMSGQNEDYYVAKVKNEPEIGAQLWNTVPIMVNEKVTYRARFHPITGDGPNRFRAYAQERPLGVLDKAHAKTEGYHLEVDGSKASQLTINVHNRGARNFTNDVATYIRRYFDYLAPHLKVDDKSITINQNPLNVVADIVRGSIYFVGAVVTDQKGQIQMGYRHDKGFATGGGFSSDKYSKLMAIERDAIDEFGVIGARPGKYQEVSHNNHTFIGAVDLENCSAMKVEPATDEFDEKTIGFKDVQALRPLEFRPLSTMSDYLTKFEQRSIEDLFRSVTGEANITVEIDVTSHEQRGRLKLGNTWGNLTIKNDKSVHLLNDKNPGLIRRYLEKLPAKSTTFGTLITTLQSL